MRYFRGRDVGLLSRWAGDLPWGGKAALAHRAHQKVARLRVLGKLLEAARRVS